LFIDKQFGQPRVLGITGSHRAQGGGAKLRRFGLQGAADSLARRRRVGCGQHGRGAAAQPDILAVQITSECGDAGFTHANQRPKSRFAEILAKFVLDCLDHVGDSFRHAERGQALDGLDLHVDPVVPAILVNRVLVPGHFLVAPLQQTDQPGDDRFVAHGDQGVQDSQFDLGVGIPDQIIHQFGCGRRVADQPQGRRGIDPYVRVLVQQRIQQRRHAIAAANGPQRLRGEGAVYVDTLTQNFREAGAYPVWRRFPRVPGRGIVAGGGHCCHDYGALCCSCSSVRRVAARRRSAGPFPWRRLDDVARGEGH
jgi:hypothetical protein